MRKPFRGTSPVIGVILMIAVTVLLASVITAGILSFGLGLDENQDQYDDSLDEAGRLDETESTAATENLDGAITTLAGNPLSGSQGDLIRLSDTEVGATDVRAHINFTIQEGSDTIGNSLNSVYLEVTTTPAPDMFSNTEQSDLVEVAVDENSDGTIDQVITNDVDGWQVENGGSALKIGFSGAAYTPSADDSIIVIFEGVENPTTAGTYDLRAETSGDGNWHYGSVTIL